MHPKPEADTQARARCQTMIPKLLLYESECAPAKVLEKVWELLCMCGTVELVPSMSNFTPQSNCQPTKTK